MTEAGKHAALAKQFLEAAKVLNDAQRDTGRILFRPRLMVAGHGLELMLKSCICLNGQKPPRSGKDGHDIPTMWAMDICAPLRWHVYDGARKAVMLARASGEYPDVPNDEKVSRLVEEYVIALGRLRAGRDHPLRYPANPDQQAPRSPMLVEALWDAADRLIRMPDDFEVKAFFAMLHFHGLAEDGVDRNSGQ